MAQKTASERAQELIASLAEKAIAPNIVFGIDVGIASCGWAVVDEKNHAILAMGSRCFEPPEDPQTKALTNADRRVKRGARRVIARRAGRTNSVRRVIGDAGLVPDASPEYFQSLGNDAPDPWEVRARAVDESVTPEEAAVALLHIAKHRGFKSNSKRDAGDTEGRKLLGALAETEKRLDGRTFGKAIYEDYPDGRRRNRESDYSFTAKRDNTETEARAIIATQRRNGAEWATEAFENLFIDKAFHQRPLQSSEHLVGECPFEPGEKRAARFSYSFEQFRLLQTLINRCRIVTVDGEVRLTPGQLDKAMTDFGSSSSISFTKLKSRIQMDEGNRFTALPNDDPKEWKKDVTGNSRGAAPGSNTLYKVLGKEEWKRLTKTPAVLDDIARIITFNESPDIIRRQLASESLGLPEETLEALMDGVAEGKFAAFKGSGNISAKAARKLIPGLLCGKTYDIACGEVGYEHSKSQETNIKNINNPVVQRALVETLKQIALLVRIYGRPGEIRLELMREVGKTVEVRNEIERALRRRTGERAKNREEFLELVKRDDCSGTELQMFELLKEQQHHCIYCDEYVKPTDIITANVQIDHIYPRSRSHEDGYVNKVLCCISCNQDKRHRTPWEWFGEGEPERWRTFEARVNGLNVKREKKRRLLNKSFADRSGDFIERNKVDNSYISRVLHEVLTKLYPENYSGGTILPGGRRRVYPRPGHGTAMLRTAWLSSRYKKDRDDDRHHAMDALIVAMMSEGLYQQLVDAYRELEVLGRQHKTVPDIAPPWESFADDAMAAYDAGWLVSRSENRRARGAIHEETIRRSKVDEDGNRVFFERKSIDNITKSDLQRIPDPVIRDSVQRWVDAGKPEDERPLSANGDPIRKLRLPTNIKTAVQVNRQDMGGNDSRRQGGYAENSSMVRTDVFHVTETRYDSEGRKITPGYYLVPVYLWQIIDKEHPTPINAIVGGKPESEWPEMSEEEYVMSLYKDVHISCHKRNGDVESGYYRGTNRWTASIAISPHNKRQALDMIQGIGVKSLSDIRKTQVDRLGVPREIRAKPEPWPGLRNNR